MGQMGGQVSPILFALSNMLAACILTVVHVGACYPHAMQQPCVA